MIIQRMHSQLHVIVRLLNASSYVVSMLERNCERDPCEVKDVTSISMPYSSARMCTTSKLHVVKVLLAASGERKECLGINIATFIRNGLCANIKTTVSF